MFKLLAEYTFESRNRCSRTYETGTANHVISILAALAQRPEVKQVCFSTPGLGNTFHDSSTEDPCEWVEQLEAFGQHTRIGSFTVADGKEE